MAFKPGFSAWFALDNVAGTLTNLSHYTDNVDHPQTVETLDVSVFGTTSKAFITGLTDGDTIAISGPYDVTMYTHLTALKAAQAAGSSTATYTYGPGGSVASQAKISCEAWVSSVGLSTGVGGRAELSASLQVTGAVTNGTW
jgi:hypothetical protein